MNVSTGSENGIECWLYNFGNGTMNSIVDKIMSRFVAKGFYDWGRKYITSYQLPRLKKIQHAGNDCGDLIL